MAKSLLDNEKHLGVRGDDAAERHEHVPGIALLRQTHLNQLEV